MFETLDAHKSTGRRAKATFLSFALQVLVIAAVVVIPLMFTPVLPVNAARQIETVLVAPPPPPPPPGPAVPKRALARTTPTEQPTTPQQTVPKTVDANALVTPTKVPTQIAKINDVGAAPEAPAINGGVLGGVPGGQEGGVIGGVVGGILNSTGKGVSGVVQVSEGVETGRLVKQVKPNYPHLAETEHVQGSVVLRAIINKQGKVDQLQVVSGSPMLTPAAVKAVKQWQYQPYYLNGQPVAVATNITVNFHLANG